jgi:hypothetical protein
MADLTKYVMINKWDDDINVAIQSVGGNTEGSSGLSDYANIIETQLVSRSIGDRIYQDFLFVDDNNQTSNYPWEGEPTTSINATQSTAVADSINQLYKTMATTERFNVLLVDKIPTDEINLSAVYLLKSTPNKNLYNGCYFIKAGKQIKKIDIPEFELNLNELFFLTRSEYNSDLSNYLSVVEELLKKKFGQYWQNDNFNLYETINELKLELSQEIDAKFNIINEELQNYIKKSDLQPLNVEINNLQ